MPGVPHPFLDHDGPVVYAHRGGNEEHAENSVAAFADAIGHGIRYLETDTRLSADGVLMAVHDARLERVSEGTGRVADHTAAELTRLRLRGPGGELTDERIPTLADLVESWPAARWNIDTKEEATVGPLGDLLERLALLDRCCVGSFSDGRLARLRRRFGPELCTALGPREVARLRVAPARVRARPPAGHIAQVPPRAALPTRFGGVALTVVDRRFLDACRGHGVPVHVWTVNDAAEMDELLDRGVDGFMTDRPAVAVAVMRRRRLPPP